MGAPDFPRRPLADTFLYRALVRVNAYKYAKFQLPGSISFRDKEGVLKFNSFAAIGDFDTVPVPLATEVDRTPSVPLAMIVSVFTKVRGIACFQIFTPQKPGTGSQKIGSERVNV